MEQDGSAETDIAEAPTDARKLARSATPSSSAPRVRATVGIVLEPHQEARRLQLEKRSKTLAGLYAKATQLTHSCQEPADMILLGHCVREILNRLPDTLGESVEGHQGDRNKAVKALMEAWEAEGLPVDAAEEIGALGSERTIPVTVYDAAGEIVRQERAGTGANLRRAEFLATGSVDSDRPVPSDAPHVRVVVDVRRFFESRTHTGSVDRVSPLPDTVGRHFAVVERILDARLKGFWENHAAVESILAIANRRRPASSDRPIPEDRK